MRITEKGRFVVDRNHFPEITNTGMEFRDGDERWQFYRFLEYIGDEDEELNADDWRFFMGLKAADYKKEIQIYLATVSVEPYLYEMEKELQDRSDDPEAYFSYLVERGIAEWGDANGD